MGYRLPNIAERAALLDAALDHFVALLPGTDVEKVILFGSYARGALHSKSDIDLIVIRPTTQPYVRRSDDLIDLLPPGTAADLLVYTPEEWDQLRMSRGFHRMAQEEGKVIYDVHAK